MDEGIDQRWALGLQFAAFAGDEPAGSYIELRSRRAPGRAMRQTFIAVRELERAASIAITLGQHGDTFVACAPRVARRGGKDAVARVWCLWADCDSERAGDCLWTFSPLPSIVIRSGSDNHLHGYWPLSCPLRPHVARLANLRLVAALDADSRSAEAARVLRPAGTLNYKHTPPRAVDCVRLEPDTFVASDVVGDLDDEDRADPPKLPTSGRSALNQIARLVPGQLNLRSIPSIEYVPLLTGRAVTAGGFVQCPFHGDGQERTPSLHVSSIDPRWYCHANGCGKGGGLVEFYALLHDRQPPKRGAPFVKFVYEIEDALTSTRSAGP